MRTLVVKLGHFRSFRELCCCRSYVVNTHYVIRRFQVGLGLKRSVDQVNLVEKVKSGFSGQALQLHNVIDRCVEVGDLRSGRVVLARLMRFGGYRLTSVWNKVVGLGCKCGEMRFARKVFDGMPVRDTVSYNTLVSAYMREKSDVYEVLGVYFRMVDEGVRPSHITFAGLIGACNDGVLGRLREAFHGMVVRLGLSLNGFVGSALIDGYAKQMRLDDAVRAFDEVAEVDTIVWNVLIDGCARGNCKGLAFSIFRRMLWENVEFTAFTLTSVVKMCAEPEDMKLGMLIHTCAVKSGLVSRTAVCNSLMTMYSKCVLATEASGKIFEEILDPNIISWTAMTAGLMQNGQNMEAIDLYKRMLREGVDENGISLASIIPAIGKLANFEYSRQIHARAAKLCSRSDVNVNNALINMYSKSGHLDGAISVFKQMEKRDVVSCSTMITALGQHGMGKEALEILKLMAADNLQPDSVTFLSCLSACSHSGLIEEGIALFRTMIDVYNIKPRKDHFSCIVDILGRAGRVSEAETFINDMRVESDMVVWESLLVACRLHGEIALGEKAANKIIELRPVMHEPYLLLSDMYAAKGLWDDKGLVRERLTVNGLKKEPGGSWVH